MALVLVGGLLLGACSGASSGRPAETPLGPSAEAVAGVFEEVLLREPTPSGRVLIERLGPPIRVRVMPVEKAASLLADSVRTLIYYGLEATVYQTGPAGEAPLARLALTDARYTSPEGLRVGFDQEAVHRTLGAPTDQTPTEMVYAKPGPPACTLIVYLEGRKVSRLEWILE